MSNEAPLIILVGGLSSRMFPLLGWPSVFPGESSPTGTKIFTPVGNKGSLLDLTLRRWPDRTTYVVAPEALQECLQLATKAYPHVTIISEGHIGLGTGGALRKALLKTQGFATVDVMYGDAYTGSSDIFTRTFAVNSEGLVNDPRSCVSMILVKPHGFDPGLGYCRVDNPRAEEGRLQGFVEKPQNAALVQGMMVNPALYSVRPSLLLSYMDGLELGVSFSLERDVLPVLVANQGLVRWTHNPMLTWWDLGVPEIYAEKMFERVGDDCYVGNLAAQNGCKNTIVHSSVPVPVIARNVDNSLVAIIPLGNLNGKNMVGVIALAKEHLADPRKISKILATFRNRVFTPGNTTRVFSLSAKDSKIRSLPGCSIAADALSNTEIYCLKSPDRHVLVTSDRFSHRLVVVW